MREQDRELARERVGRWSRADREFLVSLTPPEVELIGEAVVLLDLRPVSDEETERVSRPGALR